MSWYNPVDWVKSGYAAGVEANEIRKEMLDPHYQRPEFKHSIAENIAHGDYGKKGEAITHADVKKWGDAKQQNYKTAETAMVTGAVIAASVATGGIGGAAVAGVAGTTATTATIAGTITVGTAAGLAVDQGFKIADNAGAITARADGSRSNGAIAKAVTGHAGQINRTDIADDAIGLATAFVPAVGKAVAPSLKQAGGKALQAVEEYAVKTFGEATVTVAKETGKKAIDTAAHHADKAKGAVQGTLAKAVGKEAAGKAVDKAIEHGMSQAGDLAKKTAHDLIEGAAGSLLEAGAGTVGKNTVAATHTTATAGSLASGDKSHANHTMQALAAKANVKPIEGVACVENTREGTQAKTLLDKKNVNPSLPSTGAGASAATILS